jgi:UDP-N-acetylglucosamine 2-epimerase (non-hydrolysing)
MLIDLIAGARPNFMKIAPITHAIQLAKKQGKKIDFRLIHTGQHYDKNMSDSFFDQLNIPIPDANLGAGGGTQAGIRSGDWTMPEEINRIVTDSITNYFFTTTEIANDNLKKNGVSDDRIFWVGNTMIDTLLKHRKNFIKPKIWDEIGLIDKNYLVMTLHRPANVDKDDNLMNLINEIVKNSNGLPLIFPVHPRTAKIIEALGIKHSNLYLIEPQGYLEFNYLVERSKAVITDSGGITEETTVLGVPCITLRNNTERPETVTIGTNELIGTDPKAIEPALKKLFEGNWKKGSIPELWDGNTGSRIVNKLLEINY